MVRIIEFGRQNYIQNDTKMAYQIPTKHVPNISTDMNSSIAKFPCHVRPVYIDIAVQAR